MNSDPLVIRLSARTDPRGSLTVLDPGVLPFPIMRAFWIDGVPDGCTRGGHAHRTQHQAIVCLRGSIDCLIDDGRLRRTLRLDLPQLVLHLPPGVWAEETARGPDACYVVFSSGAYDPGEYLRSEAEWRAHIQSARDALPGR